MLSAPEIQARLRTVNEDKASEEARLAGIELQIKEVEAAQAEIKVIKENVNSHIASLKNIDHGNALYWKGSEQRRSLSYYENSVNAASGYGAGSFCGIGYLNTDGYWFELDDLADDLEDSLFHLKSQREQSQTFIGVFRTTIYWLKSQLASLTN